MFNLPHISRLCEIDDCYKNATIIKSSKGKKMAVCAEHAVTPKHDKQLTLFNKGQYGTW